MKKASKLAIIAYACKISSIMFDTSIIDFTAEAFCLSCNASAETTWIDLFKPDLSDSMQIQARDQL